MGFAKKDTHLRTADKFAGNLGAGMGWTEVLNRKADCWIRLHICLGPWTFYAFHFLGITGLGWAVLLASGLILRLNLSLGLLAGILGAAIAAFFLVAMGTKILTSQEKLVYYHHEVAVMIATAALLHLLRQPILPYLDVTILGIGMFLVWGRLGCLMAGCCHGRPHAWGVCYRHEHAAVGFTPYLVGVRLFPIQIVESLWVLGVVVGGVILILNGHPPGTTLAWYIVTYDIGRFCFEFMRGDPSRPYRWGFSEAQWTSLLLMLFVVTAEFSGILPFHQWHIAATLGLMLTIAVVGIRRVQGDMKHQLLQARHIQEVAGAIELVSTLAVARCAICEQDFGSPMIHIGCTSLGVQISASRIRTTNGLIHQYTLSLRDRLLTKEMARLLTDLILQMKYSSNLSKLIEGNRSVFHLVIYPVTDKLHSE